jgi:ribosomal protein S18 acetylase RimI-like enzyme
MVAVRRASPADVGDLILLMKDFYAESGFPLDHAEAAASFESLLASPALGDVWLALEGDRPVGHAVLTVRFTMEHGGLSGYVDDLYVVPAARCQGVGRRLLTALFAEGRARGCRSMQVEVAGDNAPALALYGRFGLHPVRDGRVLASGLLTGSPPDPAAPSRS